MRRRRHSRNRCCSLCAPLLLLALWSSLNRATYCDAQDGGGDPALPPKGDPDECLSLAERWARFVANGDENEEDLWYASCDDSDDDPPPAAVPDHGFALQFYASLPAFAPDYGTGACTAE